MHTMEDLIGLAMISAITTLDQVNEFGSIPKSRDAHYENLIDTLYEHRQSLVRGLKLNFGKILRLAHDTYDTKLDELLNE